MIVKENRTALDTALGSDHSICILLGAEDSVAGTLHTGLEAKTWGNKAWQEWFLIADASKLTADEKAKWFGNGNDYAYLGRNDKSHTVSGKIADDLMLGDDCDFIQVKQKYGEVDQK